MADISASDLLVKLNIRLRDTLNRTFTAEEKTQCITEAIHDPYVAIADRDESLTTVSGTYSYTFPSGFQEIYELGLDINGDGIFHAMPRDVYDLINGTIYFDDINLPATKTIQINGVRKLDENDLIPDQLQDYVLTLAQINALELLKTSLTTRFLTNDMTMSDLLQAMSTLERKAERLRTAVTNQRLVTL